MYNDREVKKERSLNALADEAQKFLREIGKEIFHPASEEFNRLLERMESNLVDKMNNLNTQASEEFNRLLERMESNLVDKMNNLNTQASLVLILEGLILLGILVLLLLK